MCRAPWYKKYTKGHPFSFEVLYLIGMPRHKDTTLGEFFYANTEHMSMTT